MNTEAQRARNARKRAKLRSKERGGSPNLWSMSLTTYVWDGWHNYCFTDDDLCRHGTWPAYHVFWGGTCTENMMGYHLRIHRTGRIYSTMHEVSSHMREVIEAHGESVSRSKAFLQSRAEGRSSVIKLGGWDPQAQRQRQIDLSEAERGLFLRTELVVFKGDEIGGHVWQGIGDLGIGAADVVAALLQ